MNEQLLRYHDAAQYARQILGDDVACRFFDRLNKLAKTNSLTELKSIVDGWRNAELAPKMDELEKAIKAGVQFRAGDIWDAKRDATQSAWAALLETGKSDASAANSAGQTAARAIVRAERRFVPFPELDNEDGSVETIHPCDIPDLKAGNGEDEFSEYLYRYISDLKRKWQVLNLRGLTDEDFNFLISYIAGYRKGRARRADRNRAQAIRERLRRHVKSAMDRECEGWDTLFKRPSQTKKPARKNKVAP